MKNQSSQCVPLNLLQGALLAMTDKLGVNTAMQGLFQLQYL